MIKKIMIFLFIVFPILGSTQEYVDVIGISYAKTADTGNSSNSESTTISIFDSKVLFPVVLNEKSAIITGFDFSIKRLQLFTNELFSQLYYTRLKLGITTEHSDQWTGTYVFLPVIASDYINLSSKDVYLGAIAFWTRKIRKNLNYKFGFYSGNEAFGLFITPLVGLYYISPNLKYEITALMPGIFDANMTINKSLKLGIDYKGISETFKLHNDRHPSTYAENSTLEFATYLENNSLVKNLLLRVKVGYAINDYRVYNLVDKIDLSFTPIKFGNNRTILNSNLNNSALIKVEAIYRFNIPSNK